MGQLFSQEDEDKDKDKDKPADEAAGQGAAPAQTPSEGRAAKQKSRGHAGGGASPSAGAGAGAGVEDTSTARQFSVEEALAVYRALTVAFAEPSFQQLLRRAEARHPHRGQRGHPDQQAFTVQLQGLVLHILRSVLPKKPWCLQPGWEGFRQLAQRTMAVAEDARVAQARNELNRIIGLPRNAVLKAPAEEPVVVHTPDGSGHVPKYDMLLLEDADGDLAHEFWEETKAGPLKRMLPAENEE